VIYLSNFFLASALKEANVKQKQNKRLLYFIKIRHKNGTIEILKKIYLQQKKTFKLELKLLYNT